MKKLLLFAFSFSLFVVSASAVLAVGGGGGGGGGSAAPACSEDTWTCSDWNLCSEAGKQTRVCTLTLDCASTNTPKPAEEQNCEPPKKAPTCLEDTWQCSDWSSSCNTLGQETRTCQKTFDCPNVDTASPEQTKACDHLQCGNKPKMYDRVLCRLNLAPVGIDRELAIQYLPEECRVLPKAKQAACIARYLSYKPCWNIPDGEGRLSCARQALSLDSDIKAESQKCAVLKINKERISCRAVLRSKVYALAKFRTYDLEERAEEAAADQGIDLTEVAKLVTALELQKQAFNNALTAFGRRRVLLKSRELWKAFVKKVKVIDNVNDGLDATFNELKIAE